MFTEELHFKETFTCGDETYVFENVATVKDDLGNGYEVVGTSNTSDYKMEFENLMGNLYPTSGTYYTSSCLWRDLDVNYGREALRGVVKALHELGKNPPCPPDAIEEVDVIRVMASALFNFVEIGQEARYAAKYMPNASINNEDDMYTELEFTFDHYNLSISPFTKQVINPICSEE